MRRRERTFYVFYIFASFTELTHSNNPPRLLHGLLVSRVTRDVCVTVGFFVLRGTNTPYHQIGREFVCTFVHTCGGSDRRISVIFT